MNGKGKIPKNRFQAIAKKYSLYLAIAGVAVSFIFSLENYSVKILKINIYGTVLDGEKICAFKSNRDLCILHNNNDFRNTFIYHVFTATASLDI